MRVSDYDFRFLHLRFFYIEIKIFEQSEGVLALGYISEDKGIEFAVLDALDYRDPSNPIFFEMDFFDRKVLPYDDLLDVEIEPLRYEEVDEKSYSDKIRKIIDENKVSHKIKETRELDIVDEARDKINPDIVVVYIVAENKSPEPIPVKMTEVLDTKIVGNALRKTFTTNAVNKGDRVEFQVGNSGGRKICIAYV